MSTPPHTPVPVSAAATFIGIDYHKRYSVWHALDAAGQSLGKGRIEHHSPLDFAALVRRWPNPRVVLEGIPAIPADLDTYSEKEGGYIDKEEIDVSKVIHYPINPKTGFYDLSNKSGVSLWKFDFSQWQEADLFYISTVLTRYRYCTQRFKDLVDSNKFTKIRFTGALNPEGDWFFA